MILSDALILPVSQLQTQQMMTSVVYMDSWRTAKFFDWQHRIFIYRLHCNTITPTHAIGHPSGGARSRSHARTI